jgi:hypothetical protein
LIGPYSSAELEDSMGALKVPLTAEEACWLRTGEMRPE